MKLLDAVMSRFGGHPEEHTPTVGARLPLTKNITNGVRQHMSELTNTDLSHYTFERRHTTYPGARFDLIIYDDMGDRVLTGRETDDGRVIVWR